ncbi:hypothetical protein PVK06_021745 [Gossypium arboreum]|uniref:Uncharacterized protein n=1 Tax=Gossypium arboreum TaxID=29729 RepID=A0ABR0PR60_GOSAR|nr:hypothetical protein PVK06_021745 [Gossypium arboreum]
MDDCILFGEATERGAISLKQILHEYEGCSGANTQERDISLVTRVLGVRCSTDPERYLVLKAKYYPSIGFLNARLRTYLHLPGKVSGQLEECWKKACAIELAIGIISLFGMIFGYRVMKRIRYSTKEEMQILS